MASLPLCLCNSRYCAQLDPEIEIDLDLHHPCQLCIRLEKIHWVPYVCPSPLPANDLSQLLDPVSAIETVRWEPSRWPWECGGAL